MPASPDPLRFEARPYKSEGGYSVPGLLLAFVFTLAGAAAAGALAGWVSQWIYLIVIFPGAVAFVVGFCGAFGAQMGKLRNPLLGFLVGVGGGFLAMAAMHYVEFRNFLAEADKLAPGVLDLNQANSPLAAAGNS